MDYEKTCCFTGHRPDKLPWGEEESDPRCLRLKEAVARAVEDAYVSGVRRFITGMARGVDLYCAETVLELREKRQTRPSRWRVSSTDTSPEEGRLNLLSFRLMLQAVFLVK